MLLFLFAAVLAIVSYTAIFWLYITGYKNYPSYSPTNHLAAHDISACILVPCRNPEANLVSLLQQLERQLGNQPNIEIAIIDDFSSQEVKLDSDSTYKYISLQEHRPDLSNRKNNKKEAIALGVELTSCEYIICLDADVVLSESWWQLVSNFIHDKRPKFAAGLHRYIPESRWLTRFLILEQDILTYSSIAALQLRIPTMCNGANMIFSKQAFEQVEGYEGLYHINGGDDLFLYHRIYKLFPQETYYIKNINGSAYSKAPLTLDQLLKQRVRWIRKTAHYENIWIDIQAGIILFANILAFIALFYWVLLPIFLIKVITDLIYTRYVIQSYRIQVNFVTCILFTLLYPFYSLMVISGTLFYSKK